eukprot:CAMPEP_0174377604 /NCGR_PEP_ID=MMETSP0811_2-20130205/121551_1 /TAXON_ID=73025 ORGANISM="Eutreptiella gymnastica-like, Strain CCMP1594" /NCGR_SAMPLE_ID=MMETSP0811_2 /ASSEMBLY_ACC=CAM_ASM_000667 /LENGTH=126 /DNA_ID=CAMNT_0015529657 /DNA_START=841 /DNA_END=1218 /DNA_ORIENTATION=-
MRTFCPHNLVVGRASDAMSLSSSTPLERPLSTDVSNDTSESVSVCEEWDDNPDPDPEVPVPSLSLARDGEGGLEGGVLIASPIYQPTERWKLTTTPGEYVSISSTFMAEIAKKLSVLHDTGYSAVP